MKENNLDIKVGGEQTEKNLIEEKQTTFIGGEKMVKKRRKRVTFMTKSKGKKRRKTVSFLARR